MEYSVKLKSVSACEDFIKNLHKQGKLFHLEDDPSDIGIFTDEECRHLKDRVSEIFNLMDDPFELCVELNEKEPHPLLLILIKQQIADRIKEIVVDQYENDPEDRQWYSALGDLIDELEGVKK
jgi:hypothetical protein